MTTSGPAKSVTVNRSLTLKLERLDEETWRRLRSLAAEAASYANHLIDARWATARGYSAPATPHKSTGRMHKPRDNPEQEVKAERWLNAERFTRGRHTGELSSAAYIAAEKAASTVWQRIAPRALSGYQGTPRFSADRALSAAGVGVKVIETAPERWSVRLVLQAADVGPAFELSVAPHTKRDRRIAPLMTDMARGRMKVGRASLVFEPHRGICLVRLSYKTEVTLPPMGDRVATLGFFDVEHQRLVVRLERSERDFTDRITELQAKKDHFDGIMRRIRYSTGRAKGAVRLRRALFLKHADYGAWARDFCHRWSRELVDWLVGQGVGRLVVLPLSAKNAAADWPAHMLVEMLGYKGEAVGIEVDREADVKKASTARAVEGALKTAARRAKRAAEAARTLRAATKKRA